MSERGAEGILRRQSEAKAAAAPDPEPAGSGPAGARPVGRVKSAAAGAASGSGGGPSGAGLGALTGLLSGGKGKRTGGNKALVGEFVVCMVLLGLSPLAEKGGDVTVGKFLKKGSATAAVFIILGFISASGQSGRKVASGLGLLMTLTILLNERSVFGTLVKAVGGESVHVNLPSGTTTGFTAPALTPGGNPQSFQDQNELGGAVAVDAGTAVHDALQDYANDPTFGTGDGIRTWFDGVFGTNWESSVTGRPRPSARGNRGRSGKF